MTPKSESQNKKIRDEKRHLIMDVSLHLFAEEGYHSTSISKIARKAGISKGLLYNYFSSKEDLLQSIIFDGIHELISAYDLQKSEYTEKDILNMIDKTFDLLIAKKGYYKLYYATIIQQKVMEKFEDEFRGLINPFLLAMHQYFKKRNSENPQIDFLIFGSVLDGISLNYIYQMVEISEELLQKIKERIIKIFIN